MGEKLIEAKGNFIQWPLLEHVHWVCLHLADPPECSFPQGQLWCSPAAQLSWVRWVGCQRFRTMMPMTPLGALVGSGSMAGTQGSLAACLDVTWWSVLFDMQSSQAWLNCQVPTGRSLPGVLG